MTCHCGSNTWIMLEGAGSWCVACGCKQTWRKPRCLTPGTSTITATTNALTFTYASRTRAT